MVSDLEDVVVIAEEMEAYRLQYVDGLDQTDVLMHGKAIETVNGQ